MAPDPKPPGRKRGRPPNASKPTTSASQDRPDEYEADVEEAARPKQRGRPKKSADTVEQSPPQEEAPKRKRGRPSLDSKDGDATAEAQPKRKRGRPSLEKQQNEDEVVEDTPKPKRGRRPKPTEEQQEEQPDEDEVVENAEKPKRRRRAKPTEEEQNEEQQNEEDAVENAGKKKRGKRTKPTEEEQQQDEEQQPRKRGRKATQQQEPEPEEAEPAPKKRRRREAPAEEEPEEEQTIRRSPRNSLRDLGPESVHNKGAEGTKSKKKKGRASDTREQEAENQQDEAQPKKRGRRKGSRPSTENAEAAKEQEQEQQDNTNKRRRRTSKEAASSSDEELPSPPKPYPHIAPYTRTIKSSTIAAKWTPLRGASLPAASSILTLAHQPILQRTSSTRNRRTHASAALHLVSRRIERKLARGLPFPPASSSGGARTGRRRGADADGGRALELDFEAVLDGKTALERQLVPAKHAVELLRAEKARMEQELEDDYEKLRKLEADARAQTRERKDLYRKAHVLAPTSQPLPKDPDNTITTDDRDTSSSLKHLVDTPLEPLALQLAGHVESIRGNLQQADGVAPQLARTKAALQDVLHRYLDSGAYEQVLLG
ncbi:hypothetical protein MRS44_007473 [Fusarium solani]|uniref:uncharacterized protein n=1 Tax=Fusarium solani TaxID=169388 RepID=UPI0032C44635|nr:hypothetical protein MRS44_007473 [Fusarium solani]